MRGFIPQLWRFGWQFVIYRTPIRPPLSKPQKKVLGNQTIQYPFLNSGSCLSASWTSWDFLLHCSAQNWSSGNKSWPYVLNRSRKISPPIFSYFGLWLLHTMLSEPLSQESQRDRRGFVQFKAVGGWGANGIEIEGYNCLYKWILYIISNQLN